MPAAKAADTVFLRHSLASLLNLGLTIGFDLPTNLQVAIAAFQSIALHTQLCPTVTPLQLIDLTRQWLRNIDVFGALVGSYIHQAM